MKDKDVKFWRAEMKMLDKLYAARMEKWQKLIDAYDLKFQEAIRGLPTKDFIRVSSFYPFMRSTIAQSAFNYPKLFFTIEDEEADREQAEVMERASQALMRLMKLKRHMHQAIFDALLCTVGWLRIDYNPPGDDLIAPYTANDAMHEDLTAVTRCKPGHVQVDPAVAPQDLGTARYIREKMWVPLEFLLKDEHTREESKKQLRKMASDSKGETKLGDGWYGEPETGGNEDEREAQKQAMQNGDFLLVDRIHDRINKRLIMFVDGIEQPIQDREHPFAKRRFTEVTDSVTGQVIYDEETGEPVLDMTAAKGQMPGELDVGWLVEDGFPFVAVKFDLHADSFYPEPRVEYINDLQMGIIESLTRQANMMKRSSRQMAISKDEVKQNPEIESQYRDGVDGQLLRLNDPNSLKPVDSVGIPPEQYALQNSLQDMMSQFSSVEFQGGGGPVRSATEAAGVMGFVALNREWDESVIADAHVNVIRNCFQIMGSPLYVPENFAINVAPDGEGKLVRALRSADFLWEYRVEVRAGSMQPLVEQLEAEKAERTYLNLLNNPLIDQGELTKWYITSQRIVDVDKLLLDDENAEAIRAAQMENDRIISQLQDPGVIPQQDHTAHAKGHTPYRDHPTYQQLMFRAQQGDQMAAQQIQQIDALMMQHMQGHMAAAQEKEQHQRQPGSNGRAASTPVQSIQSAVQSNAQNLSNIVALNASQGTGPF